MLVDSHSTFYYYVVHVLGRYSFVLYYPVSLNSLYFSSSTFPHYILRPCDFQFAFSIRSSHALLAKLFIVLSSIFHETCYSCSYLSCYCPYHSYCPYIAHILLKYYRQFFMKHVIHVIIYHVIVHIIHIAHILPKYYRQFFMKHVIHVIIYHVIVHIIQLCPHPCPNYAQILPQLCPKYCFNSAQILPQIMPIFLSILSY